MRKISLQNFIIIGSLVLFACLDRITKILAIKNLSSQEVFLVPNFLQLKLFLNDKIAFFLPLNIVFLTVIILLAAALIVFLIQEVRAKHIFSAIALSLIIFGALSNLFDRLAYGYVIDFIEIPRLSSFNLADLFIIVGIGAWFIEDMLSKQKTESGI